MINTVEELSKENGIPQKFCNKFEGSEILRSSVEHGAMGQDSKAGRGVGDTTLS